MTAAEKIDLIIKACPPIMLDNPNFELHVSPSIYLDLINENEALTGQRVVVEYRGYPLVIEGRAAGVWIATSIK